MAVLTAISSMGGRSIAIFSDALNHASIIDGARLACRGGNTTLHVYRHNDMTHLEQVRMCLDLLQCHKAYITCEHLHQHTRSLAAFFTQMPVACCRFACGEISVLRGWLQYCSHHVYACVIDAGHRKRMELQD